jgi:hypothetical protein
MPQKWWTRNVRERGGGDAGVLRATVRYANAAGTGEW